HQMLDHHLVERLIIAIRNQFLRGLLIKRPRLLNQPEKRAAAVHQMRAPMLHLGGSECVNIETDVFAVCAVAVALESAYLVKGATEVCATKGAILIVFQSVLVI